jgi:proteasome assembly chaperone (PAC2) family protein
MEGINIVKRPRLKNPYLIVAWPGMGEVAFQAASFLVESLKCEELASIPAEDFFYLLASEVREGVLSAPALPESKFYFWKNREGKNDLIIFLSNAQPDLARAQNYSERIIQVAKSFKVERIIGFASMPAPIDHMQEPQAMCSATSKEINEELKLKDLKLFKTGQISGMNGIFLGIAQQKGINGVCLMAEIPLYTIQIENPKASAKVLSVLCSMLNIPLDLKPLHTKAQAMQDDINKLIDFLKLGAPGEEHPISEEDIEKIKNSLSQLTKLPLSVKEKIEGLFKEAGADIAKARFLKAELDKWNVYREYEDRFLDLFKKKGISGN